MRAPYIGEALATVKCLHRCTRGGEFIEFPAEQISLLSDTAVRWLCQQYTELPENLPCSLTSPSSVGASNSTALFIVLAPVPPEGDTAHAVPCDELAAWISHECPYTRMMNLI